MTVAKVKDNTDVLHMGRVLTEDDSVLCPLPKTEGLFVVPDAGDEVVAVDNKYYIGVAYTERLRCNEGVLPGC